MQVIKQMVYLTVSVPDTNLHSAHPKHLMYHLKIKHIQMQVKIQMQVV